MIATTHFKMYWLELFLKFNKRGYGIRISWVEIYRKISWSGAGRLLETWGYVSWQWRIMQNFSRNWMRSSKLTFVILQILNRELKNLKNLHLIGVLLAKAYTVWAEKSPEELCLIVLNINAKFDGKLTCASKNEMRNLINFYQSTFKSLKIWTFVGCFYPK